MKYTTVIVVCFLATLLYVLSAARLGRARRPLPTERHVVLTRKAVAQQSEKSEVKPKLCFIVAINLVGEHSPDRVGQAVSWMTAATLRSVAIAAQRLRVENGSGRVAVVLTLGGSYARLVDKLRYPPGMLLEGHNLTVIVRTKNQEEWTSQFPEAKCPLITILRLDADDSLVQSTFTTLAEAITNTHQPGKAIVSGTYILDQISVLKRTNASVVSCLGKKYKRPYFHSVGLSVTLEHSVWKKMGYPLSFGDHSKVRNLLQALIFNKTRTQVSVLSTVHYPLGIYWITQLSGHFSLYEADLKSAGACKKALLVRLFPQAGVAEQILKVLRFATLRGAVPQLSKQQMEENRFWTTIQTQFDKQTK